MTLAGKPGGYVPEHQFEDDDNDTALSSYDQNIATVVEFLKVEGFRPEITESGRVYFKFEGHHVYFEANENDEQQFNLYLPNIWPLESGDHDLATKTANHISDHFRCIKGIVIENGQIWIGYEAFYESAEAFTRFLNRTVERLQYGARRFVDLFNETKRSRVLN